MRKNKLTIIVSCYNEEKIIEYSISQLTMLLDIMIDDGLVSTDSQICFVNDGSTDNTKNIIEKHCKNHKIGLIDLGKNYGQQSAILAGLNVVNSDIYVTIDADLQDDHMIIAEMVKKYLEGYEIVYGCRKKRETDSFFKKSTAFLFYKFMNLIGINIRQNHSEFRLMSKCAVEKLKAYKEKTIFLRGIIQNIGLKSCNVYYNGLERLAGKTKYSFFKLLELAWSAITSFSIVPLRIITITGLFTSFISLLIIIYALISYIKNVTIPGWTSIIMTVAFFSGIIIMSLGIIGEYLSKVLIEVKNRPLYQIEDTINVGDTIWKE